MTDKEMIEQACKAQGLTIQKWRDGEDGKEAILGRWRVATDEYEDDMLYADAEGVLTAYVVGAERYRNRAVQFGFTEDGTDGASEVRDLTALEPDFAADKEGSET